MERPEHWLAGAGATYHPDCWFVHCDPFGAVVEAEGGVVRNGEATWEVLRFDRTTMTWGNGPYLNVMSDGGERGFSPVFLFDPPFVRLDSPGSSPRLR